jgi:ketosteroid isomerase-like protein
MAQENVAVVRRVYEAWNRGDIDGALEFVDRDVEMSLPPNFPEAGTYRGLTEVRRLMTEHLLPTLENLQAVPERFLDAGDQVVAFVRYSGRGSATGIEVRGSGLDAHLWSLRGGKVESLRMYPGTEEALEAAGLRE